ncbi:MAG TPA: AMP-binding protein [Ottowia sp.]|uniref:AMP-binding protein n=1 Tax=Ottowia sp. TaxID=1898956 RepID=UPI002CA58BD4|nr:AMP-binding protein [Ottowia sp.]HMN21716.1 AMP-binding protein [Ottowia sp.]
MNERLQVEDRTLLGSLQKGVALRGDRPAVRFTDGGDHSAASLLAQAGRFAALLLAQGAQRGDRVAIVCSNRVEFIWAFFGACWIGAVPAPLNTSLQGRMLRHQLDDLEAAAIVCEDGTQDAIAAALESAADARLLNIDRHPVLARLRAGDGSLAVAPATPGQRSELAMILYTSGTTGLSKGIMYSHEMAISFGECTQWMLGHAADDVAFNCLPLFHGNSLLCTLVPALRAGSLAVFGPRFSAGSYWNTVREHKATVLSLLGSMVPILLNQPPTKDDADTPARIALAVPNPNQHFHEFEQRFRIKLSSLYGMTDIGLVIGVPHDVPGRPGKCGIEHPDFECVVCDENDNPLPDGEVGELLVRPRRPFVMQLGYWRNAEATVATWRNLWFHTGDYLRRDSDGWYEFIDRKKDAIRRFGENISSFEVECALLEHPAVAEAAVYAVPAQLSEDEVMVSVVPMPDASVTPEELLRHCEASLPYYAVPRFYRVAAALPKTQTAKVQKAELRRVGVDAVTWDAGPRGRSRRG